jgi:hypothetical protein
MEGKNRNRKLIIELFILDSGFLLPVTIYFLSPQPARFYPKILVAFDEKQVACI